MLTRHRLLAPSAVMIALPVLAADALQVKTGLWETTTTSKMSGISIPADALAQMPPAQRAQMEQMMKQMTGAQSVKDRSCVTQKDLQDGPFRDQADPDAGNCKYTQVAATTRRQEWSFQCSSQGANVTGKMTLEASDSTHVKGLIDAKGDQGGMNIQFTAQWLSASCAGADKE